MEGKPDDGSPPFHPRFKPVGLEEEPPQPHQPGEQEEELAMGEVTSTTQQEFAFPTAMDTGAGPWPLLLHFPGAAASTTCTNAASAVTNPAHLLPPFAPHLPYGYEGLLLPPDASSSLGLYRPSSSGASPFGPLHPDYLGKMSAQEIMDAKALAASRSHSEAERRRRERINGHLARLRSLLPSTTKTDKASLLAEVIQHVKELKRQTSEIAEESPVPTEADELSVDVVGDDEAGAPLVKASLCCDDRPDLLPELIKALRAMRMRALKAEIVTLGGRVRNVLLMTGQDAAAPPRVEEIQEALRAAMEKAAASANAAAADEPSTSNSGGSKRQRTGGLAGMLEKRSI